MKFSLPTSQEEEQNLFGIDDLPQKLLLLAVTFAGRMDLEGWSDVPLFGCLAVVPVALVSVGVYGLWLRRPMRLQSESLKRERQSKLHLGFWNVLWRTWALYVIVISLMVAFRFVVTFRDLFLPAFWMYATLNWGVALFDGVVASLFSWWVTRRLVAAPLVSTP